MYHYVFLPYTVNVDIFELYIILHNSHFLSIRKKMYMGKQTFIMPCRGNDIKNKNIDRGENVHFVKS